MALCFEIFISGVKFPFPLWSDSGESHSEALAETSHRSFATHHRRRRQSTLGYQYLSNLLLLRTASQHAAIVRSGLLEPRRELLVVVKSNLCL